MSAEVNALASGNPVVDHLHLWSSVYVKRATTGRGSNGKTSPYGIQKLRELILELAVRGKLVPQDPNDEPASVLLDNIAEEKARLVKEKKIKKQKTVPEINEEEKPFTLPESWAWQRFVSVFYPISVSKNKVKTSEVQEQGKVPVVDQGQSFISGYIDKEDLEIQLPGPVIVFGDHTSALKYIDFNFVAGADGVKILRPLCCDERYFFLAAKTLPIENRGYGRHYSRLTDNLFPLPPLEEQHRIVAKVDELMALCEQLEQQQTDSLQAHQTLVETLLRTLVDAGDAESTQQAWNRIAEHFDTLFTTEASIDQLKQTILQLAVMGKLVPQDTNDKPVEVLKGPLEIPKGKSKKKTKWSGPIEDAEKPFKLPSTWTWFRLGDVSTLKHGYAFSSEFFTSEPASFVLTTPGNFYEKGGFRDRKSKRKYYNGPVNPEFIFDPGDLIIPMTEQAAGLLGSPAFIPDDGKVYIHNQRLGKMTFDPKTILPEFAFWFFNCTFFRDELARTCTGMKVRHTSPDRVLRVPFPVCPLAEQLRIVAKVDELMTLCDALKTHIKESQATQVHLADAVVEQAVA
ncbi:MAG: restriction endonuclease subunit S [Candidatus Sedimenticola sp. (ex Thyasira tokunagai)]